MKQVISFLLILPFFVYFVYQPIFNHIAHLEQMYLEVVIDQGIEKAAVEGRFTNEIINEMKDALENNLHFAQDQIQFEGTQNLTPRGQYIWGRISLPDQQFSFLPFLFGNSTKLRFYGYAKQMSEYTGR